MTTKVTPLPTPRKDAILQIAEQMQHIEGKKYSFNTIANNIRRESGKWIFESRRFRYEVTDAPETKTEPESEDSANVK